MKKESADHVVCGTDHTFGLTILGGGVWARETVGDAVVREESAEGSVYEFAAIVTLPALDDSIELLKNIKKETLEGGESVGFIS